MIAQTTRDPWRATWRFATSDGLLAVLLLGIAVGLTTTVWLPQTPLADPAAYARWLSETQTRFGKATSTMQTLGLFALTRSFVFRALLSLLAGCLLLQLIESGNRLEQNREIAEPGKEWQALAGVCLSDVMDDLRRRHYRVLSTTSLLQADRWPWADLFPLLARGGGLLLLVGLLLTHLWGWQVKGLIIQSGERVTLPGTEKWVALDDDAHTVTYSPGIMTFVEERGPGVQASATDSTGHSLSLQQTTDADPVTQLTVALTEDQYFAIPEAQLILRLAPQPGRVIAAHSPVLVQVYRSPPGRLETESVMEVETELTMGEATLELTSAPYARLTATFNPGLWPTAAGLVLLVAGPLGSAVWPVRRFWLREEAGQAESTGDLLPALARGKEA